MPPICAMWRVVQTPTPTPRAVFVHFLITCRKPAQQFVVASSGAVCSLVVGVKRREQRRQLAPAARSTRQFDTIHKCRISAWILRFENAHRGPHSGALAAAGPPAHIQKSAAPLLDARVPEAVQSCTLHSATMYWCIGVLGATSLGGHLQSCGWGASESCRRQRLRLLQIRGAPVTEGSKFGHDSICDTFKTTSSGTSSTFDIVIVWPVANHSLLVFVSISILGRVRVFAHLSLLAVYCMTFGSDAAT